MGAFLITYPRDKIRTILPAGVVRHSNRAPSLASNRNLVPCPTRQRSWFHRERAVWRCRLYGPRGRLYFRSCHFTVFRESQANDGIASATCQASHVWVAACISLFRVSVFVQLAKVVHQLPAFLFRKDGFPGRHGVPAFAHFPEERAIRLRGHELCIREIRGCWVQPLPGKPVAFAGITMTEDAVRLEELLPRRQIFGTWPGTDS